MIIIMIAYIIALIGTIKPSIINDFNQLTPVKIIKEYGISSFHFVCRLYVKLLSWKEKHTLIYEIGIWCFLIVCSFYFRNCTF